MGKGLFELRVKGNDGIVRLFYVFQKDKKIYILHGFVKKTQKTPKKELEIAYTRMKGIK
ncbi:MAG: type II toxin-antitoxin system RelE/ParE family toxin [Campylobacter sp.]|nr:type II toxin-antitoxin system RelE/ParE family toxin [Campylobacter sp.]